MRRANEKAPVREHQGQGDGERGNAPSHIETSVKLENEGLPMSITLQPEQREHHTKGRLSTAPYQRAICQHVGASKLTYTALAILTDMPLDDFAEKMQQTECVFNVGELALLARALRLSPAALIEPPHQEEKTLKCVRKVCSVRHHQKLDDGRQGDMCRIDGMDNGGDLWDVFALSNGVGERWNAGIDLNGCDDLEGDTGIAVMREALAAFAKAQAYCNTLNESEGLN